MSPPTVPLERPYVVLLYGGKGGIAKTTIAEHLAWGFSDFGKTLLLDADSGQMSAKFLYDRYACEKPFDMSVGSDPDLIRAVHNVPHRYVVIDGPPSRAEARAAVEVADLVVVPMVPRIMDTGAVMRTIKDQLGGRLYRVALTRITTTMGRSRVDAVRGALEGQGVPVLGTALREYLGPHEAARAKRLPITHPDLAQVISKPNEGTTADRAAFDLKSLFAEVHAVVGGS